MRVAIVAPSPIPYVFGGVERAARGIVQAIRERPEHECELIVRPSPERTLGEIAASYQTFLGLDLFGFDRIVSTKYPAWMVDHPVHDVYLFHRLRGLYDTYPAHLPVEADIGDRWLAPILRPIRAGLTRPAAFEVLDLLLSAVREVPDHPALAHPGPVAREVVHALDGLGLAPAPGRRYFALSSTVTRRPGYFPPGAEVTVLPLPSQLRSAAPTVRDQVFTASRLDGPKRVELAIEAYRRVPGDIPFRIAGTGPAEPSVRALAAADPRVELVGFLSDTDLAASYERAIAVPFVPADEDWGLVALEALSGGAPVVTCTDSGGPVEIVVDGESGLVTDPDPESLGVALDRILHEPGLAATLSGQARQRAAEITWAGVVDPLTAPLPDRPDEPEGWRRRRHKVVVCSTYTVHPARHGGMLRCWHLARALASDVDVVLLCLAGTEEPASVQVVADGILQWVVPRSPLHRSKEVDAEHRATVPLGDVLAGELLEHTPALLEAAASAFRGASAAVLAHPYLADLVERVAPDLPVVYDAHNVEHDLKRDLLDGRPGGPALLARVADVEGQAITRAAIRVATSTADATRLAELYDVDASSFVLVPNAGDVRGTDFVTGADRREHTRAFLARLGGVTGAREEQHVALFIGSWHQPNIDAASLLIELAPSLPSVLFVLAGGHTLALPPRPNPDNVVRSGPLGDAAKDGLLRAATIALNPMTTGSGTNLKLVEYLAAGVPVITTPIGARGIPIVDGVHARVVDVDALGSTIRDLTEGPPADGLAAAGRGLVEAGFDWSDVGARFTAAITTLVR